MEVNHPPLLHQEARSRRCSAADEDGLRGGKRIAVAAAVVLGCATFLPSYSPSATSPPSPADIVGAVWWRRRCCGEDFPFIHCFSAVAHLQGDTIHQLGKCSAHLCIFQCNIAVVVGRNASGPP
ncbi:unnamed protein product [Lactuca virosa]|uniref:Uncharacterized protein n=1 Tax=Lactuca virosa TaxID=75947 RepID=A0AAU9MK11_9ASTR|nr:unnamed protein product [Lactuca virosa]